MKKLYWGANKNKFTMMLPSIWLCHTTGPSLLFLNPSGTHEKRFFTPLHLLALYKAQIRPCLEYGSHLWSGASKYSLATLDTIQKRAIRLIYDSALTDSLDSLAHRRNISALSLYYRYYHGGCSDELKSVIPPKACFARSRRFANSQHSLVVKLEKCRTTSFPNMFVSMTSRNWNSLPASIFPSTYNLQTFKTRVYKNLRLHPLTWSTFPSLR